MRNMNIAEIRDAVSGKIVQGDPRDIIKRVSIDSRNLKPGELFIAIIGEQHDGHRFISKAVSAGARALIVDRSIKAYPGVAIIIVEDTTRALQQLAHYYRMQLPDLKVVGVTGSAGKTTTKDMIASVLQEEFKVAKTPGNFNNYYGLPLTLLELEGDEDVAVLEMGMSRLGEISLLTDIARPQIGVITNVGPTHLESLKTVANVAQGKRELIEGLPDDGIAVLNYDNPYVQKMEDYFQGKEVIYYGLDSGADVYASDINYDEEKGLTFFQVNYQGEKTEILLDKPGEHNVYNALAAISIAQKYGIGWEKINSGLAKTELSSLRWDVRKLKDGKTLINDTYNANPLSMKAAIKATKDLAGQRIIAVLGDMLELGPQEERAHLELGRFVLDQEIDFLLTVGELSHLVAKGALEAGMSSKRIYTSESNQEAAEILLKLMTAGDTVLVKGSRSIKMEEIVEEVVEQEA